MRKRWMFAVLLFVFGVFVYAAFAEGKTEMEEEIPVVMVEVKRDVSVKEFYDTNSLIRSRMFYEDFLKRFCKVNEIVEDFDILPVGIYFIPVDGIFFKNTKTGIYPVMKINAEPGMTAGEFYRTNSLINRKLSWNFFIERFAEFQEIPNEEKEFRKLKPGAWILPVANVFFWTPQGMKSFTAVIHSKEVEIIKETILFKSVPIFIIFFAVIIAIAIFMGALISDYLIRRKLDRKKEE